MNETKKHLFFFVAKILRITIFVNENNNFAWLIYGAKITRIRSLVLNYVQKWTGSKPAHIIPKESFTIALLRKFK